MPAKLDELCITALRILSADAVQQANSGHPGAPMGMAAMAFSLWDRFLKHNPADPKWPDRDRFVLSAGHASALLYSLLHLTGYDLSLEDIKNFRQWESKTPGHPEYGMTPGVETTAGPLGQGFANGVGMALAEKLLAEKYNCPGHQIIDHYTYAIVSDGDLMEGVAAEAASLAGTMKLGKLIYLYDDNDISIEGHTDITFTENVSKRFEAYGWQVIGPVDGISVEAITGAIEKAQGDTQRPSLIICTTTIGYGSPNKANTAGSHGEPLGEEELQLTRQNLGWTFEPFEIPGEVSTYLRESLRRGADRQNEWEARLKKYAEAHPQKAAELQNELEGKLSDGWDEGLDDLFKGQEKPVATRSASGTVLNAIAPKIPALSGGSADLAPSNKTEMKCCGFFSPENASERNLHFGVREHAMGAIANGMALHGGIIPYTGTFLVFYDYMRPPVRLAAMMGLRVIFVFTHDSIGVGEDGPTHQPVEQLVGLRSVPNLVTLRPADATETAQSWKIALERADGPTALILSRQNLPVIDRVEMASADGVQKGAYILWEASPAPDIILIATGSEVEIALDAGKKLNEKGISARVVSMPSCELFEAQPEKYRESVLPCAIRMRVSIEASIPLGWERYVGLDGAVIGIPRFGASAPGKTVYRKLGITAEAVVEKSLELLEK